MNVGSWSSKASGNREGLVQNLMYVVSSNLVVILPTVVTADNMPKADVAIGKISARQQTHGVSNFTSNPLNDLHTPTSRISSNCKRGCLGRDRGGLSLLWDSVPTQVPSRQKDA